jgi:hypothetical protein
VSEVSPGHLKFKWDVQRLLKKVFYWQRKLQLYGPPYIDGAVVCSRMLPTSKRDAALNFLLLIWARNSAAT